MLYQKAINLIAYTLYLNMMRQDYAVVAQE